MVLDDETHKTGDLLSESTEGFVNINNLQQQLNAENTTDPLHVCLKVTLLYISVFLKWENLILQEWSCLARRKVHKRVQLADHQSR